ncbi:MAG TPA: hypothetical protein VFV22_00450 [Candidatus Paceibacterota bacterium]|nr:hypothetical protein [Candidatus Paceibacterota bacterium]
MTTKKNVKKVEIKKGEVGNVAKVGFGLTAAAATVAGAYFLYGSKKAAQNRKKVKGWALKAKGEVLEALENAQNISEEEFKKLVETASSAYGTVKSATKGEVEDFKKEMATHWKDLQKNTAVRKLVGAPIAKKSVKKAPAKTPSKKVAQKTTSKK